MENYFKKYLTKKRKNNNMETTNFSTNQSSMENNLKEKFESIKAKIKRLKIQNHLLNNRDNKNVFIEDVLFNEIEEKNLFLFAGWVCDKMRLNYEVQCKCIFEKTDDKSIYCYKIIDQQNNIIAETRKYYQTEIEKYEFTVVVIKNLNEEKTEYFNIYLIEK